MGLPFPSPPGRLGLLDYFSKSMEEGLSSSHSAGGPEVVLEKDFVMISSSGSSSPVLRLVTSLVSSSPPGDGAGSTAMACSGASSHRSPCSRSTEVSEKGCRLPIQEVPSSRQVPSWPGAPCPGSCRSSALAVPPAALTAWQL